MAAALTTLARGCGTPPTLAGSRGITRPAALQRQRPKCVTGSSPVDARRCRLRRLQPSAAAAAAADDQQPMDDAPLASTAARLSEAEGITSAAAASPMAEELEEALADATAGAAPLDGASDEGKQLSEMLAFAVPALGMVLADPLMSLIDTACVGRLSSLQLAALGPNTAIFSFSFQLVAFLGVATTNVIASNSLRAPGLSPAALAARRDAAERTLCNSLQLAVALGLTITAVLFTCGRSFLAGMGTAPELLAPAWSYLSIRAVAAPAVLIMSVAQGACLGQQDAWTPFAVLATAGLLNAVGDVYLIFQRGMGVAGAAAATAAAQYLGAVVFLVYLWHAGRRPGALRLRWTGLPRPSQMREFLTVAGTLLTRVIFGMAAYCSITSSATRLGTLATATHQVAMQTFWFLSYFPEPLSLAAQSLLARDRSHPQRSARFAWLLLRSGAALGLLLAAACGLIFTRASWLFTTDAAVQAGVAALAPIAMLALCICSTMMMADGISVGSGSFAHLPPSNVAGLAVTLGVLQLGARAGWGLNSTWWALTGFYITRTIGHTLFFWASGSASVFAGGGGGDRWRRRRQQ